MDGGTLCDGIQITPSVIQFRDIEKGCIYQTQVTVQNFGATSKRIRFHSSPSDKFILQCKFPDKVIAPGLQVSSVIEFHCDKEENYASKFILLIDDDPFEIPLTAIASEPGMEITGDVHFGTVVADSKIMRKEIAILNRGSKNGAFKLVYEGIEPITIIPKQGVVKSGYSQPIRFEFTSKKPGNLDEVVKVNMEGQADTEIHVYAQVALRSLQLLSLEDEHPVNHINFGPTFYGTDVLKSYLIFNKSPERLSFVVILEEEGEGQEAGVNLSLVKSAALLDFDPLESKYEEHDLTTLVTAFPSQGTLAPYEKRLLYFKFSPRFSQARKGWSSSQKPFPRKDYALFLHIDTVGSMSSDGGSIAHSDDARVEVALTGTALPVLLSVLPSPTITFDNCPVGSSVDCKVTVRNDSSELPFEFAVSKCAHFVSFPHSGRLEASEFVDLIISFRPNQVGHFTPKMNLLVQGSIVTSCDRLSRLPKYTPVGLCEYPLHIEGKSLPVVGQKTAKSLSAQGRLYPQEANENKLDRNQSDLGTSLKVFGSSSDCMLESKSLDAVGRRECKIAHGSVIKIAKPDDMSASIRPSNKKANVMTKYTRTKRYTYVDPDYEYTEEEDSKRRENRQKYIDYIHREGAKNTKKSEPMVKQLSKSYETGMGINTDAGLAASSSKSKVNKAKKDTKAGARLITSKDLETIRKVAAKESVAEGLKALPTTDEEKAHCAKLLSPLELYKIGLEPKIINFGEVCGKSLASQLLKIVNSLETYIHFKVEIDCRELRQTSPLSQIIPPRSVAALEFIFEPSVLGHFERSISYSINNHYNAHLLVRAEVVNVSLTLSTKFLSLSPTSGLPPDAGMRDMVTLYNKHNVAAQFSWTPVVGKEGTAFSVRPARGSVDSHSNLVCEVVFYPSFHAPLSGIFKLNVENGNQLELNTQAEVASTSCSFVEHRVMFGAVPLNLVTTRSAFLKNTSQNHAYFKVTDISPIPGMTVSPAIGVIPVGGSTELKIDYKPILVQKFDTQIEVAVKGWKPVYLRMGGHVESPSVDIDIERFQFGGVYCGARSILPFKLKNMARSRAKVAFDLTGKRDFSVTFGDSPEAIPQPSDSDDCFETVLYGQQELQCYLEFKPTEIASYDFVISAVINETSAPSPPPSPYPASVALSKPGYGIEDSNKSSKLPTPSRRIQATALRAPLQISNTEICFDLPPGYYDMGIENAAGRIAGIMFVNNSNTTLSWNLNLDNASQYIENGIFQLVHRTGSAYKLSYNGDHLEFPNIELGSGEMLNLGVLFSPGEPGIYETFIPVILGTDTSHPYRMIHLRGELAAPTIHFEPRAIQFLPAPLRTKTTVDFNIVAQGFRSATIIQASVPQVELEDGSEAQVFEVEFPNGNVIEACCRDVAKTNKSVISCRITFESPKPASINTHITFVTQQLNCLLPIIATADNCLMTSYKFLAVHQTDFHIVCDGLESKEVGVRKGINELKITSLVPSLSAIKSPTEKSTTTTSTSFGPHSSTYGESSLSSSTVKSPDSDNKDGVDHEETTIPYESYSTDDTADTDEERYVKDVVKSVQRWFSSQAWANGPSPVKIPFSLRSCFSSGEDCNDTTRAGIWSREKKKESKTIFDMVTHLCGKAIPGIPINGSIPIDPFDRTRYIYWMYTVLVNFLRCQGAIVASLQPEFLLDKDDFKRFVVSKREDMAKNGIAISLNYVDRELERYETISKRAWTDLLLQIIKVLVLNRITPQAYRKTSLPPNYAPLPPLNVDPFSSNVFSVGEKIVLAWVNHHFKEQRDGWLWKTSITGECPSSRWIVNFDNDFLDGLVLASMLAAYAPFMVPGFLYSMYTHPVTAEQCLHNALKVVDSLRYLGMDYDIVATDITEPNAINMLLLCIFLYHRLPNYIPRSTIEFNASLHSTVTKKIKLQNPSSKPIVYQVIVTGENSTDFRIPAGKFIKVASKSHINLEVQYKGRFLRSCFAVLILVGKRAGFQVGSTLVFRLTATIDTIIPMAVYKTESPCYELKTIELNIKNPFEKRAVFKVVLVEVEQQVSNSTHEKKEKTKRKSIKNVESRTDHGIKQKAQTKSSEAVIDNRTIVSAEEKDVTRASISVFWCSSTEIAVGTEEPVKLTIEFLPFSMGHFQCSVLLVNEDVGDIVYSIEAESYLPLPSTLPTQPSAYVVRMGDYGTDGRGSNSSEGNSKTVYWRCNINDEISEDIIIPLINEAREKALVTAAHQRMSEKERCRRQITGILSAATISNTLKLMGLEEKKLSASPQSSLMRKGMIRFEVEGNSKYFQVPSQFDMSLVTDKTVARCTAKMPVKFTPDRPGHYQCRFVLRAPTDIRVFQIEVTVNPDGSDIELEFTSPTHEAVTQTIPVVNNSEQDWTLLAKIEGTGFHGPKHLSCPRRTTASYALQFQPLYEGMVKGSLTLMNTVSGTETVFLLSGEGRKPLPCDNIELDCKINDITLHEFQIPNMSNKKITFQAFCNLDFISGPENLVVLPKQTGTYTIFIKPWKRGVYNGVISFVSEVADSAYEHRTIVSDSDDNDDHDDDDSISLPGSNNNDNDRSISRHSVLPDYSQSKFSFKKPFRIWYSLRLTSHPAPPLNTLEVECACHNRVTIELLIENPASTKIECEVLVEGRDLIAGEEVLSVQPKAAGIYNVEFAPTVTGSSRGSVIFQHPLIGEVWYDIVLISVPSMPKELKMMQCPLGSKCIQMVRIDNPTDEIVTYEVFCSNNRNFWLDLKNNKVDVLSHSGIEVPLKFSPSALGRGLHDAEIVFRSTALGDFVFKVTGNGLLPARSDDYVIRTSLSSSSSTIITFENPFEEEIIVNVDLSEKLPLKSESYLPRTGVPSSNDLAFTLLLRKPKDIFLPPLSKLGIPICFSPESMVRYEAICTVSATKTDGTSFESNGEMSVLPYCREMRWVFPVVGIPEFSPMEGKKVPCIECKTKQRVEEMLQLSFTGLTPSLNPSLNPRLISSASDQIAHHQIFSSYLLDQSFVFADFGPEYSNSLEDFTYEFQYPDNESHSAIDRSVGINLLHKMVHRVSDVITLVFKIVFSPFKAFSHTVQLILTSSKGGVWRFPLKFYASEADPDDVIELEAVGLNKDVSVGFRLTSQSDCYVPFWVSIESNSNQMFSVGPVSGKLPPVNSLGQLFKVTYRPNSYGKVHTSKLIVQTPDAQWTYALRGCLPKYIPPSATSTYSKMKKLN